MFIMNHDPMMTFDPDVILFLSKQTPPGYCDCGEGERWVRDLNSCVDKVVGSDCRTDKECSDRLADTQCKMNVFKCDCLPNYSFDTHSCKSYH